MQITEENAIVGVVVVTLILLLLVIFIVAFLLFYQRKRFRYQQEKTEMKDVFEREILKTQMEIQEQTFETVSHEIHDNVGQVLSVARIYTNSLREGLPTADMEYRQKADQVHELIGKAIQDLRDISKSRNTGYIERAGLLESLRFELDRISRSGQFKTAFTIQEEEPVFDTQQSIILFRICQELLNNAIKHSGGSFIGITVGSAAAGNYLKIQDNGRGFNMQKPLQTSGTGLGNIEKRAHLIGAKVEIENNPGGGTLITIKMNQR
ncbi:MAG: hypothetical protein JST26_14775 [Bacteroidetes bacterium]|nr:hypothetical protein [Bacteroidota bacterium]